MSLVLLTLQEGSGALHKPKPPDHCSSCTTHCCCKQTPSFVTKLLRLERKSQLAVGQSQWLPGQASRGCSSKHRAACVLHQPCLGCPGVCPKEGQHHSLLLRLPRGPAITSLVTLDRPWPQCRPKYMAAAAAGAAGAMPRPSVATGAG